MLNGIECQRWLSNTKILSSIFIWYTVKSIISVASIPKTQMFLVSSRSCVCPIHWSYVLCCEWRWSWNSADRQCSNYIWVINKFIIYKGASTIRDLTVTDSPLQLDMKKKYCSSFQERPQDPHLRFSMLGCSVPSDSFVFAEWWWYDDIYL